MGPAGEPAKAKVGKARARQMCVPWGVLKPARRSKEDTSPQEPTQGSTISATASFASDLSGLSSEIVYEGGFLAPPTDSPPVGTYSSLAC